MFAIFWEILVTVRFPTHLLGQYMEQYLVGVLDRSCCMLRHRYFCRVVICSYTDIQTQAIYKDLRCYHEFQGESSVDIARILTILLSRIL